MPTNKYGRWDDPSNPNVKKIPYCEDYIDTFSKSNQSQVFRILIKFTLYCEKTYNKSILDVNAKEVLFYFKNVIDKATNTKGEPIKKVTKIRCRSTLKSYYDYVKEFIKKIETDKKIKHKYKEFKNPVPSYKIWDFAGSRYLITDILLEDNLLTMSIVKRIFTHLYYVIENPKVFIIMSLILYSGARVSEICHIELKNVDLENRWVITQVKSRKSEKRVGIYFFPEFFVKELKTYIIRLKTEYQKPKYLFQQGESFYRMGLVRHHLRRTKEALGLKCNINPHAFRDFINTLRIEMRIPRDIRKMLLNQKVSDVNIQHYAKKFKNRLHLRELYDKSNPFKELIKPTPRL
ncbi:MAG: tyrosine-type recombinase/integrase [Candidatus Hodarchaeota archaeon]